MMKTLALLLALTTAAFAQSGSPTKQSGSVTPTHAACWTTNGIIQDCGTAAIPYLTTIGTVGQGPTICANSAPVSVAFVRLCLAANTNSASVISVQNFGGATPQTLAFEINGTTYSFPFVIGGIVGPVSSVVNDVACWNNITGTLLQDCGTFPSSTPGGISGNVQINQSGAFGGITNTQLTALINQATSSNNGALPAYPGNTTTFFRGDGTYSGLPAYPSGANPSATAGPSAVNGSSPNFMRADATPAIQLGSASQAGLLECGAGTSCFGGVISASGAILPPGGRLVLAASTCSGAPDVQMADVASSAFLCYVPHTGATVPLGGANVAFSTLSCKLGTNINTTGMYDVYVFNNSGTVTCCTDITAWANNGSTNGTGASRTSSLTQNSNGYFYNTAQINQCRNDTSLIAVAAGAGLEVGVIYATGTGVTSFVKSPQPVSGGTSNCICVANTYWNARVQITSIERDLVSTYTYGTQAWRCENNSCSNSISVVDSIANGEINVDDFTTLTGGSGANGGSTIVCQDNTVVNNGTCQQISNQIGTSGTSQGASQVSDGMFPATSQSATTNPPPTSLGYHTFYAMEEGGGGTSTVWNCNGFCGVKAIMER